MLYEHTFLVFAFFFFFFFLFCFGFVSVMKADGIVWGGVMYFGVDVL